MDGTTIMNQVISGGIIAALTGIVAYLFKINTALSRLMLHQEQHNVRLDKLETQEPANNGQHRGTDARSFKRGSASTWLLVLLGVFAFSVLSGCKLLGLDMEQAQQDAEETSVAMELLVDKAEAISIHIAQLEESWKQADADNDIERMGKLWPQLQAAYKDARLSKTEIDQLQVVFSKRVTAFKEAKDTTGYLQAALGLFAGGLSAFFPGLSMIRRRDRIIKTTAQNVTNGDGRLARVKELQKQTLTPSDALLLDQLRA
ncbi:hypothetical protein OAU50_03415 [Planctomycetota bacterium]|nr:hypothetical protein [Planctomycetota bacterium]